MGLVFCSSWRFDSFAEEEVFLFLVVPPEDVGFSSTYDQNTEDIPTGNRRKKQHSIHKIVSLMSLTCNRCNILFWQVLVQIMSIWLYGNFVLNIKQRLIYWKMLMPCILWRLVCQGSKYSSSNRPCYSAYAFERCWSKLCKIKKKKDLIQFSRQQVDTGGSLKTCDSQYQLPNLKYIQVWKG